MLIRKAIDDSDVSILLVDAEGKRDGMKQDILTDSHYFKTAGITDQDLRVLNEILRTVSQHQTFEALLTFSFAVSLVLDCSQ